MAKRRFNRVSTSDSIGNDGSDSDPLKSNSPDSPGGSSFSSDFETRSVASRGTSKESMPVDSPLLCDELESGKTLCGDNIHALSIEDVEGLREVLGIPPECETRVPGFRDDCHSPPLGYFTLFLEYFTSGLMFPPQPLLVELVRSLGMSFSQLTPNAIIVYSAFCHKMREDRLPLSVELFHSLFLSRRSKPDSFVYFCPRPECKFLSRIPCLRSFWKSQFFYVKDCGWGIPVVWSSGLRVIALKETHRALQLQCRDLGLFDKLFNPRILITAGIFFVFSVCCFLLLSTFNLH